MPVGGAGCFAHRFQLYPSFETPQSPDTLASGHLLTVWSPGSHAVRRREHGARPCFWADLYAHEFDRLGAYFTPDAVYDDVPIPAALVVGPAAIVRKLRIGFERVARHTHHEHRVVADETTVVTEHTEDWHFAPDHVVVLPFVSVQVIADGRIALWRDYSNIDTLLGAAPAWWIEHVTASWAET